MFTPSARTTTEPFQSRQTPAIFSRPAAASRETQDAGAGRADMTAPRPPAASNPDDWTRECLFDCYND